MKASLLEKFVLVVGMALVVIAGLSLFFCIATVGLALDKGGTKGDTGIHSIIQGVGYWPLYTTFLFFLSACCFLGAEPLARAVGKKQSGEHRSD